MSLSAARLAQPATIIDVYARISDEDDSDRRRKQFSSPEAQAEELCEEVVRRDAVVGKVFMDTSKSAWKPKVVRPDWLAMMARLESGESDGLIVWDVSRFTRKVLEGERLVAIAEKGMPVWSLWGEYDLSTADGLKAFRDAVNQAAYESNKISERAKRGKRRKAERGRSNACWRSFAMPGWAPRPEGWEADDPREMVPDQDVAAERDLLREVARRLLGGETLNDMVRLANARGFRTVHGGVWTSVGLRQTLVRPSVAGIIVYDGAVVASLPGEPVLDRETWERLTAMFDSRKRGRPNSGIYLLSGLLHCGRCGEVMYGRPMTGRFYADDGTVRRQYWCRKTVHGVGCGRSSIDMRWADAAVEVGVLELLGDPRHADRLAKRLAATRGQRAKLTAEVHRLNADADALASKVASWGVDRVDKAMTPIIERLAVLGKQLSEIDGPESSSAAQADTAKDWHNGTTIARRAMIRRAFPRLTLRPAMSRGAASLTQDRIDWIGASLPAT